MQSAACREQVLQLATLARALLSLLGTAADTGLDRYLEVNTVSYQILLRQESYWNGGDSQHARRLIPLAHGSLRLDVSRHPFFEVVLAMMGYVGHHLQPWRPVYPEHVEKWLLYVAKKQKNVEPFCHDNCRDKTVPRKAS